MNDNNTKQCIKHIDDIMAFILNDQEDDAYRLYEEIATKYMGNKKVPTTLWALLGAINAYLINDGSMSQEELESEYIETIHKIQDNQYSLQKDRDHN